MKSFSNRVEEAKERFGEYIGSDIVRDQGSIHDALNRLIDRLNIELRKKIEDYNKNTFMRDYCGELDFQEYLDYFKDLPDRRGSFNRKWNIDFSRFKSNRGRSISFSKDSLNLKASRLSLYALYRELDKKIKSYYFSTILIAGMKVCL